MFRGAYALLYAKATRASDRSSVKGAGVRPIVRLRGCRSGRVHVPLPKRGGDSRGNRRRARFVRVLRHSKTLFRFSSIVADALAHARVRMRACVHARVRMRACVHARVCMRVCACACVHARVRTRTRVLWERFEKNPAPASQLSQPLEVASESREWVSTQLFAGASRACVAAAPLSFLPAMTNGGF
jgi:hypothetical protein